MDADLVRIETERENNFLVAEIKKLHPGDAFIVHLFVLTLLRLKDYAILINWTSRIFI